MRIVGADPGIGGALAVIDIDDGDFYPNELHCVDMPVVEMTTSKRYVEALALRDWLVKLARADIAFIELVNAMPSIPDARGVRRGMGASSAFQFGDAVGTLRTTITLCGVPFERVVPVKWKAFHGLLHSDKEASRRRVLEMLPTFAQQFARKRDEARAEAVLIALYGAAKISGRLPELARPSKKPKPQPDLFTA